MRVRSSSRLRNKEQSSQEHKRTGEHAYRLATREKGPAGPFLGTRKINAVSPVQRSYVYHAALAIQRQPNLFNRVSAQPRNEDWGWQSGIGVGDLAVTGICGKGDRGHSAMNGASSISSIAATRFALSLPVRTNVLVGSARSAHSNSLESSVQ